MVRNKKDVKWANSTIAYITSKYFKENQKGVSPFIKNDIFCIKNFSREDIIDLAKAMLIYANADSDIDEEMKGVIVN